MTTPITPPTTPRPPREAHAPRWTPRLGAWPEDGAARFRIWSPESKAVDVVTEPREPGAGPVRTPLARGDDGTFSGAVPGLRPGDRYRLDPDRRGPYPDPASRFQPDGVHGPSELVDHRLFPWTDDGWTGLDPDHLVIYELHVGTFSPEGTFEGVTRRLPRLRDLGVTAIELMPVAEFAGERSWGYDGVALYAPSRAYGRPEDLRRLVDEAHRLGLGVILDVVYNHFGPVGNYAVAFSPGYLARNESSAWAACVNLREEGHERVREFFVENALHWVHEYHLDGLRLDATHALVDDPARPFVAELVEAIHESAAGRRVLVTAEDHRNRAAMLRPRRAGGWGLDGVWADDLHHQLRRHVAGDEEGYYRDYRGTTADVADTINRGWFYRGQWSEHLGEHRGDDPSGLSPRQFVVCLQNHDQVGNRAHGDRLHHAVDPAAYRALSTLLLTLPQTPLLFMGQEWAATAPFQYFTDHDPELGRVVTEGRRREFRHFRAFQDPAQRERIPDPQAAETFARSRLDWSEVDAPGHSGVWRLYRDVLALRQAEPSLRLNRPGGHEALAPDDDTLLLRRDPDGPDGASLFVASRFRGEGTLDLAPWTPAGGAWEVVLTSDDPPYAGESAGRPEVDLSGPAPRVAFWGPAAVVLRRRPDGV